MAKLAIFAGLIGALLISGTAAGQSSTEPQPDPVRIKLVQEMFAVQGGQEALRTRMKTMFDVINTQIVKSLPPAQQKFGLSFQTNMEDQALQLMSAIMQDTLRIYARDLTEQELRDELAWLKSESGQSIRRKLPGIQREVMADMLPAMMERFQTVAHSALEATCAQEHCTSEDHAAMAQVVDKAVPASGVRSSSDKDAPPPRG